jgi:recombinational DNA repair protein (RecF pathway)
MNEPITLQTLRCDRCGRELGPSYSIRNGQKICDMCRSIFLEIENVIVFSAFDSDSAEARPAGDGAG